MLAPTFKFTCLVHHYISYQFKISIISLKLWYIHNSLLLVHQLICSHYNPICIIRATPNFIFSHSRRQSSKDLRSVLMKRQSSRDIVNGHGHKNVTKDPVIKSLIKRQSSQDRDVNRIRTGSSYSFGHFYVNKIKCLLSFEHY